MTKLKRRYTYLDHDTDKRIENAAKELKISVSTWIKLACLKELRRDKRKEGK